MSDWKLFCEKYFIEENELNYIRNVASKEFDSVGIYPDSINYKSGTYYFIVKGDTEKSLILLSKEPLLDNFTGMVSKIGERRIKICPLDNKNCDVIRSIFPFTNPINHKGIGITIGLGDRLGLASPGHIRLIRGLPVFPVLAQQSIRELNLTGRNYHDVLSAAAWAVFQEGYTKGYGADGDHLKTCDEVKMALDCGFTMITLDCSEHIDNSVVNISETEVDRKYSQLSEDSRNYLEEKYLNKEIVICNNSRIAFNYPMLKRTSLIYLNAINYTVDIYTKVIKGCGRNIDFEMSIDETLTPTTPESHYFVAAELIAGGVDITSLAPRFCGEFQKGIDYRGDIEQFELEFKTHVEIAEHFGYKISVHSGSDKFSVFPIIGKETKGKFHLKTAGTNWLESIRIIAEVKPSLFRCIYRYAYENLNDAKKYYHISASQDSEIDIDQLQDDELPKLMKNEDVRQALHITYGLILSAKSAEKIPVFKYEIFGALDLNEEKYCMALIEHIGKHLKLLGIS